MVYMTKRYEELKLTDTLNFSAVFPGGAVSVYVVTQV
jgi:hypothetical protein